MLGKLRKALGIREGYMEIGELKREMRRNDAKQREAEAWRALLGSY